MKRVSKATDIGLELRRMLRECVGAHSNCPVKIVSGNAKPSLKGRGFHYTNKRGQVIHHPNAYMKAWGKPIYNPSTIRVEVGFDWLMEKPMTWNRVREFKLLIFS